MARYLKGKEQVIVKFPWRLPCSTVIALTDSNWAGDRKTRKSVSGGVLTIGGHVVKTWSKGQSLTALSSAEAELTGISKGAAQGLGLQTIANDLGILSVLTDATAAIGICRRRGLGKVRHLATADLWMQDRIRKGDFKLLKVAGADNPADMLTKHVDKPLLLKHTAALGLYYEDGRAESAPAIP